jgi:hypothetical protein
LGGREVPPLRYISPHLPLNSHFIQQKLGKNEREERKREEEAAKPYSHVGLEVYVAKPT